MVLYVSRHTPFLFRKISLQFETVLAHEHVRDSVTSPSLTDEVIIAEV